RGLRQPVEQCWNLSCADPVFREAVGNIRPSLHSLGFDIQSGLDVRQKNYLFVSQAALIVAKTSSAMLSVSLMMDSSCAPDTKPASKAEGAKCTPRSSIPWKNCLKRSISDADTSSRVEGMLSRK